jgi:hypothetical protein
MQPQGGETATDSQATAIYIPAITADIQETAIYTREITVN